MLRSPQLAVPVVSLLVFVFVLSSCRATTPQANPAHASLTNSRVPFVGCEADGQVGPLEAPKSREVFVQLDEAVSGRLALYQAENTTAVLGPRGWYCFGTYGSSGSTLYVSPTPIQSSDVLASKSDGVTSGSVIQSSNIYGDTSGRFVVAQIAARAFPVERAFVEKQIATYGHAGDFTFGPFPTDRLNYLNDRVVEYETPARAEGLGTFSKLRPNRDSIRGVAILQQDLTVQHLAIRLPRDLKDLAPAIIKQFELEK